MPAQILNPVSGLVPAPEAAALFHGSTSLTATATVRIGARVVFQGHTTLTPSSTISTSANFHGHTVLTASGRLNNEANVFGAANFAGHTTTTASGRILSDMAALFSGHTVLTASATVTEGEEFGFRVFIDITNAALSTAQNKNIRRYSVRILVNGSPIPVKSATLTQNAKELGSMLKLVLARPDASLIPIDAVVDFQIGMWTGAAFSYVTLLANGKFAGRTTTTKNEAGLPADEVAVSIKDVLADRWNYAPAAPIHLYDPEKVPTPTTNQLVAQRIQFESGYIEPVYVPIIGLDLREVMRRAFVLGCGFTEIISNIPNYAVPQADFTMDGGYDAGARAYLDIFSPLLFSNDGATLFVVDPDAALPAGLTPTDIAESKVTYLNDEVPAREPVTRILVQLQFEDGEFFTEDLFTETTSSGMFGQDDYTEVQVERRTRQYRNISNPFVVVREEEAYEKIRVYDKDFNLIEETTLNNYFDSLNRKSGFLRRVSMRLPNLNNIDTNGVPVTELLTDVQVQNQTITYTTNPLNPNQDIQNTVTTVESGLVVVDAGNQYLNKDYRIPLLDAHRTAYVDGGGDQHIESATIRTTTERMCVRGQQVDIEVRVRNHLSNAPDRTKVTTRPGGRGVAIDRRRQQAARTVMLKVGTETVTRRAFSFNAGLLPANIAMPMALRRLARLNNPPREISVSYAYVDLSVRRGQILRVRGRGGVIVGTYIVTGRTINASTSPEGGMMVAMTMTAKELVA